MKGKLHGDGRCRGGLFGLVRKKSSWLEKLAVLLVEAPISATLTAG